MKKNLLLIVVAVFLSIPLSAQFVKFGLKTGLNFNNLNFDDIRNIQNLENNNTFELSSYDNITSFHLGLMSRINIFKAFVQPELYFNTSGGEVRVREFAGANEIDESIRRITYSSVDLPVLIGGKVSIFRLYAGPVAALMLSSNSEVEELIPQLQTESKKATIGFQAGTGFDILNKVTFDFRYEAGLSRLGDELNVGNTTMDFDSRSRKFMLSLGVFF